jgi:predicted PurR-regulated permease PerM
MENQPNHRINRYFFLAVIILFAAVLMLSLRAFFTAFLGAIIFYVLSKKPANWLISKRKWSKSLTAILVIVVSLFIFLIPLTLFVAMLLKKVMVYSGNVTNLYAPLKELDQAIQNQFHISLLSDQNLQKLQEYSSHFISWFIASI